MKYLKLYEDFDFDQWIRLKNLGLGSDEIYTVHTETPNYKFGLDDQAWIEFKNWAKGRGVVFASQARGGAQNLHLCAWDGPKAALAELLDKAKSLDPEVKSWGLRPLSNETTWSAYFSDKIEESTDWKDFIRLRELGLSETEFGFVIFTTYHKSLEELLGPEFWAKLLDFAKQHGVVRNSFKLNRYKTEKGTKESVFWESWIGPYSEIIKFKNTASLLHRYSGADSHAFESDDVQSVGDALEDFIVRWEWAIEHDKVLLDDYVVN